ncbi:unnamed protein product, partial [Sphacelaria rigidula]
MNGIAAKAHACYTAGKYHEALSHLNQLSISSSGSSAGKAAGVAADGIGSADFRTLHNQTLCQHALQGFTDPASLEKSLDAIRVQLRLKGKGEDVEPADGGAGAGGGGSKVATAAATTAAAAEAGRTPGSSGGAAVAAAGLEGLDADASVLLFNLSALHFQQKQYGAAQAVLEHLFWHIEPVDESLAIHICLLLLDVLCHTARGNLHTPESISRFAQQSAVVVGFLERSHALHSSGGSGSG